MIGSASGLRLCGAGIEDAGNTDGDVDGIGNGSPVPESDGVKELSPVIEWQVSVAGGPWIGAGATDPITIYFTNATPLGDPYNSDRLFDLALEKACGYVNGASDIYGAINRGIDGEIYYNPAAPHRHDLSIYDAGQGECCCCAHLFRILARNVGDVDATVTYVWGGCSSGYRCVYSWTWPYPAWSVTIGFDSGLAAHDGAPAWPHFMFHVQSLCNGTWYDPSYGGTGLKSLDCGANAHMIGQTNYPASSRQTGDYAAWAGATVHDTGQQCSQHP